MTFWCQNFDFQYICFFFLGGGGGAKGRGESKYEYLYGFLWSISPGSFLGYRANK